MGTECNGSVKVTFWEKWLLEESGGRVCGHALKITNKKSGFGFLDPAESRRKGWGKYLCMAGADEQNSGVGHGMSGFRSSIGMNLLCDLGPETSFLWVSVFFTHTNQGGNRTSWFLGLFSSNTLWVQFQPPIIVCIDIGALNVHSYESSENLYTTDYLGREGRRGGCCCLQSTLKSKKPENTGQSYLGCSNCNGASKDISVLLSYLPHVNLNFRGTELTY